MEVSAEKTVFILGISSDIGRALAVRYASAGYLVIGTYRGHRSAQDLVGRSDIELLRCDVSQPDAVRQTVAEYAALNRPWNVFISAVGTMEPIGHFFSLDFESWEQSVIANSIAQLRVLHGLYPLRRRGQLSHAVFFAGGGTNNPFTNYSAYCVSKIILTKMCELLDDEAADLNIFAIGPGLVRTKLHRQTLTSSEAGANLTKTTDFLNSDAPGTSMSDIYECIKWCVSEGRTVAGGRNFSAVHDGWRNGGEALAAQLRRDAGKFKLRRFGNQD